MEVRIKSRNRTPTCRLKVAAEFTFSLLVILSIGVCAAADGGKSKVAFYVARIAVGPPNSSNRDCDFSASIDPVLFNLTSFDGKYRVFVIRVVNGSNSPIALSRSKDKVEIRFGAHSVDGVIDIASASPQLWNGLSLALRQAIAYPRQVERGEEETGYVFVPTDRLSENDQAVTIPSDIRYSVENLGSGPIDLRPPAAAAD